MDNKIRSLRLAKKITQKELAEMIGVLQKDISRWETGVISPSVESLIKISKAFECKIDDLI